VTVSLGLRWDYDSNGNDPDISVPLVPNGRPTDTKNFQPRLGFSWDVKGDGQVVARGGAGIFAGRYLLVPAFTELQQNGIGGRKLFTRVNGYWLGLPQPYWLDPANPTTTGVALPLSITLMDQTLKTPTAQQYSLGVTTKLGKTGLYFDAQGVWVKGKDEIVIKDANWNGNANPTRPNKTYTNINTYTNEGHSEYKALVLSLNGNLKGGHVITASATFADKKNISDDFSPDFTTAYPSDPANMEAEYGRGRSAEKFRFVLSGVFRLPLGFTAAPIFEYGVGQPWTSRIGYDFNGDSFNSDRYPGVDRFAEEGPVYHNFSLRLSKAFKFGDTAQIELIAEGFNLFNSVNYDVTSVQSGQNLSGPTLANPKAALVVNPRYGQYLTTLDARQIQFGARVSF
jgi:hypothetical protein